MKDLIKLLAVTATISFPSASKAQQSGDVIPPFKLTEQGFNHAVRPEFKLLPGISNDSIIKSPFLDHLPAISPNESRNFSIETFQNAVYDNYMPVVKPGKTSDIPVRKLDANAPYIYYMPIKKSVVTGKDQNKE